MAPRRFAITAILICVGILLLSACGLPLGPPGRNRPVILGGNFALYAPDHSLVAEGTLYPGADPRALSARVTVYSPACLNGWSSDLTGGLRPHLLLQSSGGRGAQITLISDEAPNYQPYATGVLPFRGRLLLNGPCGQENIAINAVLLRRP